MFFEISRQMLKPKIEIVYADSDLLVVNKPSGVSVTKDRTGALELADILADQLGPATAGNLRLIHRLDKLTSGVMLLALNKETQSQFTEYFENRLVRKTYLAIVTGAAIAAEGIIDAPLARNRKDTNLMQISHKKGKQALTKWRLLADFSLTALLAVHPVTGRTHQIRVHLPSAGLPLAIDPAYGSSRPLYLSDFKTDYRLGKLKEERPLIERLTLHAYQLELSQPPAGKPYRFVAGLDNKFKAAIKMLTKHNPEGLAAFKNPDDYTKILSGEKLD